MKRREIFIIKGITIVNNKLYWTESNGNIHFEMKEPCKQGEIPLNTILGTLMFSNIKEMRLKDLQESLESFASRLLEQFTIVKK